MWKDHIDCTDGMFSPYHNYPPNTDNAEDLNSVITVNLLAPLYLSRSLVRHWLGLPASVTSGSSEQGKREEKVNLNKRILMISSISGLVNMAPQKQVAYNASKGGLTMAAKVSPKADLPRHVLMAESGR
jgi:NAD(P)-dependent dehydrogenase (short-subunit alcohol dehydrogenase family)